MLLKRCWNGAKIGVKLDKKCGKNVAKQGQNSADKRAWGRGKREKNRIKNVHISSKILSETAQKTELKSVINQSKINQKPLRIKPKNGQVKLHKRCGKTVKKRLENALKTGQKTCTNMNELWTKCVKLLRFTTVFAAVNRQICQKCEQNFVQPLQVLEISH